MSKHWTEDLADEISNRYELGLSDREAQQLAKLIARRYREAAERVQKEMQQEAR